MLTDILRARMVEALKAGDTVAKNVLKVALGEIQAVQVRSGKTLTDPEAVRILQRLVASDEESRAATQDPERRRVLDREIEILQGLLPRTWSEDEIHRALEPVLEAVRAAAGDGPAVGVAMKHLKGLGAPVDGKTVGEVVRRLRGAGGA